MYIIYGIIEIYYEIFLDVTYIHTHTRGGKIMERLYVYTPYNWTTRKDGCYAMGPIIFRMPLIRQILHISCLSYMGTRSFQVKIVILSDNCCIFRLHLAIFLLFLTFLSIQPFPNCFLSVAWLAQSHAWLCPAQQTSVSFHQKKTLLNLSSGHMKHSFTDLHHVLSTAPRTTRPQKKTEKQERIFFKSKSQLQAANLSPTLVSHDCTSAESPLSLSLSLHILLTKPHTQHLSSSCLTKYDLFLLSCQYYNITLAVDSYSQPRYHPAQCRSHSFHRSPLYSPWHTAYAIVQSDVTDSAALPSNISAQIN